MEYAEASKKIKADKPPENFMTLKFSDNALVLSHKDGVALLATLANAEMFDKNWGADRRIVSLTTSGYETSPLSRRDYEDYKLAALLNLNLDEVTTMRESQQQKAS